MPPLYRQACRAAIWLAMILICSQQDILDALSIASINAQATHAWNAAEAAVCDFLGWQQIAQQTWVEYYPLEDGVQEVRDPEYIVNSGHTHAVPGEYFASRTIPLRQLPVRSITEVREDPTGYFGQVPGSFNSNTILQSGTDYLLKTEQAGISWTGHLLRRAFWFPATVGSLMLTYVAGFTAGELADGARWCIFRRAVMETCQDMYLRDAAVTRLQRPDIASESLGGGASAQYHDNYTYGEAVPDRVADYLFNYRSYSEMAL